MVNNKVANRILLEFRLCHVVRHRQASALRIGPGMKESEFFSFSYSSRFENLPWSVQLKRVHRQPLVTIS